MKLNKSLLAILMIMTLLLGMLAGCNKTPEGTDADSEAVVTKILTAVQEKLGASLR